MFATCYGNRNHPGLVEDLVAVLEHNGVGTALVGKERCCGMPKLELGDLESIQKLMETNIPELDGWVRQGWDLTAVVPSCVLMFKQELPLLFPEDERVRRVAEAFYDPFEYLMIRHRHGKLKTDFAATLGSISYQVPCHLRVQNIGLKTRDVLELIPDTEGTGHRALLGARRHLRREERIRAGVAQDRAARRAPSGSGRSAALHERLPDGRRADREGGRVG